MMQVYQNVLKKSDFLNSEKLIDFSVPSLISHFYIFWSIGWHFFILTKTFSLTSSLEVPES